MAQSFSLGVGNFAARQRGMLGPSQPWLGGIWAALMWELRIFGVFSVDMEQLLCGPVSKLFAQAWGHLILVRIIAA